MKLVHPEDLPSLDDIETRYINHVLELVDGNKTRAARILKISRHALHRRLTASKAA